MNPRKIILLLLTYAAFSNALAAPDHPQPPGDSALKTTAVLPPLPAGVMELRFKDFFVQPVGSRGLELTDIVRNLDGRRVRILGYMARQEQPVPGMFLFTPMPVRLNEEHYGLAEDLPASSLFVFMPRDTDKVVPYTPGLMLLTGTLNVGNREESDGRISTVRLALEIPKTARKINFRSATKGAEKLLERTE